MLGSGLVTKVKRKEKNQRRGEKRRDHFYAGVRKMDSSSCMSHYSIISVRSTLQNAATHQSWHSEVFLGNQEYNTKTHLQYFNEQLVGVILNLKLGGIMISYSTIQNSPKYRLYLKLIWPILCLFAYAFKYKPWVFLHILCEKKCNASSWLSSVTKLTIIHNRSLLWFVV